MRYSILTLLVIAALSLQGQQSYTVSMNEGYTDDVFFVLNDGTAFTIAPSAGRSREWVSLDSGQLQNLPADDEWDLLLGSYLHVFAPETNPNPYQVTGALLNPAGVIAHESDAYAYDEYSLSLIETMNFRADRDLIGYDWKEFDFDLGFVTNQDMIFAVKSTENDFYALRFTTFYDENGTKGNFGFTYRLIGEQ